MDPLILSALPLTQNWDGFRPDMKGYIPPQELQVHSELGGIEVGLPPNSLCTVLTADSAIEPNQNIHQY